MDKILLIVDPQVDFISGSLAVEGAKEKMDALASALQNGEIDCDYVMVTKDFHPSNHCSFKENGGQWPPHCVKGTTGRTPIANGNLQARCRMKHLYDIASIRKGLVMSTDNQTEYQLGFWTIHGDVGDFDPIQDLWKTEVYGLANYLRDRYKSKALEALHNDYKETCDKYRAMSYAVYSSCKLIPTDGLGISNSDLEQIGAKSYDEVDDILSRYIPFKEYRQKHGEPLHPHDEMAESDCWSQLCARHGEDVVNKVWSRHLASEFKRKKAPIYISRELYE